MPDATETAAQPMADPGGLRDARARRFRFFAALTVICSIWFARDGGYSWHYFVQGSALLFDGAGGSAPAGGLDVYAHYPQFQIGPLSLAVAQDLRHLGPANGLFAAEALMAAVGLVVLYALERITETVRPELAGDKRANATMLVGGAVFVVGWTDLSVAYGHLDDVLALTFVVLAAWAMAASLPAIAGVCLALSVDTKPWALVFLPLILAVPGRAKWHMAVWTALVVAVVWLPFVVADVHMLSAGSSFTITNEPDSALRALGVSDPGTPHWDRTAQIVLACVLGAVAVRRRRWPALILLGVGARIALDPGVYGYYTAGVLLGALMWDLLGRRVPAPVWTLACGLVLAGSPLLVSDASLRGLLRLCLVIAFTTAVLLGPSRPVIAEVASETA